MPNFNFKSYADALNFSKKMVNEFFRVKLKKSTTNWEVEVTTKNQNTKKEQVEEAKSKQEVNNKQNASLRTSIIKVNGKFEYVKEKNILPSGSKVLRRKKISLAKKTLDALKIADKVLAKIPKERKKNTSLYFNRIKRK